MKKKYILLLPALLLFFIGFAQTVSLPITEDFELEVNGTSCNATGITLTSANFFNDPNDTDEWDVDNGGTPSGGTGPVVDHNPGTSVGKYLYTETSGGCTNNTANLESTWMNWTGVPIVKVDLWYHMQGATMGTMHFDIKKGINGAWQNDYVPSWTDNQNLWQLKSITICDPVFSSDSIKIRFRGMTGTSFTSDMAIDDISIAAAVATCYAPVANTGNITPLSADLSWTNCGSSVGVQIEWGIGNFSQGTGTMVSATTSPHSLTGLTANTSYSWYVRNICSAIDTSNWVGPVNFNTPCSVYSAPYFMDMEVIPQNAPPTCWTEYSTFPNGFAEVDNFGGTAAPFAGTQALYIYSSFGFNAANDTLMAISPQYSDMGVGDKRIRFQANSDLVSQLVIGTMSAPGPSGVFTPLDTTNFTVADTYVEVIVNLTTINGYNGTDQYVALKHDLGGIFDYLRIDNFNYEVIPTCSPRPSLSVTSGITFASAAVSWTNGTASVKTQVEYGPTGFTLGTGTQITDTLGQKPISGLIDNTVYDWYVRVICAAGDTSFWSDVATFKTLCLPFTAPYFMDMEGIPQNAPPTCWTEYSTFPNGFAQVDNFGGTAAPFAGTQALYLFSSFGFNAATDKLMAISPQYSDIGVGDKRIRFQANSDLVSQLVIGTMSSSGLSGVFTPIDTTNFTVADSYVEVIVNLTTANGYNGTDQYVALRHNLGGNFDYIRIDNFNYEVIPSCPGTNASNASNITGSSADLGWTENGVATNWEIEWGTTGFVLGTGTRDTTSFNPHALTGLAPLTTYDFYVRAICSIGDTSIWSGASTFGTGVAGPVGFTCTTGNSSIAFSDDLESTNGWTGDIGTGGTGGSWNYDANGTPSNGTGPSAAHSGTQYVYFEGSGGNDSANFVSPSIDLSAGNNFAELSFWIHAFGTAIGTLDVGVGTSATGPFTTLWSLTGALQASSAAPFQNVGVNLDTYVGQTIYLQFNYNALGGFAADMTLDLIEVSTCASCTQPSALTASNVSLTAADLGWIENGTATAWEVEYGVAGFIPGTGTTVQTTTNPHAISALSANTAYEFRVRSVCAPGDTSIFAGPQGFRSLVGIPYVANFDAFATGNPSDEGWSNGRTNAPEWLVDANGTPSNNTGPAVDHTTGTGNYVFLETSGAGLGVVDTMNSPPVLFGATDTLIQLEYYYHMFGGQMGSLEVWFDTNGVWNSLITHTGQQQAVQIDPWLRSTQLLSGLQNQAVTFHILGIAGTGFQSDMAIDDFSIDFPPSCLEPTALMANLIGSDTAVLAWTDWNTATQWEIEWGPLGFTPGTGTVAASTSNPFTLTGLTTVTDYSWRVRAICGAGDTSLYSSLSSFKTIFQCPVGAICVTYTAGDISSDLGFQNLPGTSTCPDSVVLAIPIGNRIDSMSTLYDMTAIGARNAWISEQRSWLFSPTSAAGEATMTNGPAINAAGTSSYSRTGLSFANGATGNVAVQMHAGRTFGGAACAAGINDVDNGSWTVIAYHSTIPGCLEPFALTFNAISADSATLAWTDANTTAAPEYQISYGLGSFSAGSGTQVIVTANSDTISGLSSSTSYDWYVRAICVPGDTSIWSSAASFTTAFACPVGAICATYTTGEITSDLGFQNLPGTSTCLDSLMVAIPLGNRVDSVGTFYDMTATVLGNAWISEQNTWLYSPTTMSGEATITDGPGINTPGTASYSRSGLTFANGGTGNVVIQMHAGRDFGGTACSAGYNDIDSASWTVLVYHSAIPVGIENSEATSTKFELVPNPTKGLFEIRSSGFNSSTITVSIRDLSGRLVSSELIKNTNGNFTKSFDMTGESKGVYFITIMDGESVINKKLIVR